MSTQVVRVEGYSKGSLSAIGNEFDHNPNVNHRNSDIDLDRSHLNMDLKYHERGFYTEWNDIKTSLNASYKEKKGAVAFEGMVITADKEFFEKLGYVEGQPMTKAMERYFRDSYEWAVQQIGYRGTDKNILGAKVHMDEGTPHLHIYYLPVVEKWREKVYERDAEGKILRTERGTPIQAKDERGKTLYRQVEDLQAPKLARTEFWAVRGGQSSYRMMQDSYQEKVGKEYGLERGEVGSDRQHKTKHQYEHEQLRAETQQLTEKITPLREMKVKTDEVDRHGRELPFGVVAIRKKKLTEIREQAHAYVVNRDEVLSVRDRLAEVSRREREVAGKEAWLNKRENELAREYGRQRNLNNILEATERERDLYKKELTKAQNENTTLKDRISELERTFEQRVQEVTEKLQRAYEEAQEMAKGAYICLKNVVQATGLIAYGKDDYAQYRCDTLPLESKKLIDGVAEYGAYWAEHDGFHEFAEDMRKTVSLKRGVDRFIHPERYKEKEKVKEYEHEH